MVFELLRDCFTPEDLASGFDLLFELCTHIAQGRVSPSMAYLLGASRLLALEKPSGGVRPIAVGEVLYRLVARTLGFQFREALADHFSPLQFGVATRGGCETIIHGLCATLDLHPDWVVLQVDIRNAFNIVSREAFFRELRAATDSIDQLFPFVRSFYARRSPLYFSHCSREDEVTLFSSESGTRQGDPLGGALFALAHLCALRTMASEHPLCLFPSLADDTHIVGPPEAVVPAFHTLEGHLSAVGLTVQPTKCAAWSPSGLSSSLSLPPGFSLPSAGLRVLGAPIGSDSFQASFVRDALEVDVSTVHQLPLLGDPQIAFGLLSRCYAQRPGYLLRTTPPSLALMSTYACFDDTLLHIVDTLMGSGSFSTPEGLLA
ncbi:hypothetical protein R1flu_006894 [Riccia fluitans]|uniref:Reverse transcriptase domain-containing protein n=1 Tax=Riccia fluitans TaxID=41844 RepID=A0ABD1YXL3_9MARC